MMLFDCNTVESLKVLSYNSLTVYSGTKKLPCSIMTNMSWPKAASVAVELPMFGKFGPDVIQQSLPSAPASDASATHQADQG